MKPQEVLKQYFGYDHFRGTQEGLVQAILTEQDTLGIMPTGAGKSICYQIPALMMSGITLVISPLISLMKDQVDTLIQAGVPAAYINSTLTERQIEKCLHFASSGKYKIIYVAPERLLTPLFQSFAQSAEITIVAVDEAHCISQWGNDFRPSYTQIPTFIEALKCRPVLSAFTATATPQVKDDIIQTLRLNNPKVSISSFDRPNLFFETKIAPKKDQALVEFLKDKKEQTGIVYCSTRKNVEKVYQALIKQGFKATYYHGGLSDELRGTNQEDFIYDRSNIIVATNAFGMGIDKSNVAYIVHYNMPMNIENYYQEAGRAGRDGAEAHCLLLYSKQDIVTSMFLIDQKPDSLEVENLKMLDRKKLHAMDNYANTKECLRKQMLSYFGEHLTDDCENCSNCKTSYEVLDITEEAKKMLSTVYRMKERFGSVMILDTLTGAKNKKLLNFGLDKLSTYGISQLNKSALDEILSFLIETSYLEKGTGAYPIIRLGPQGRQFLFEKEARLLMKTRKPAIVTSKKEKSIPTNVDAQLLTQLKETRTQLAKKNKVPAYIIFSDSTLIDMCTKLPKNTAELLTVSGVGGVKAERFGEIFLGVIKDFAK